MKIKNRQDLLMALTIGAVVLVCGGEFHSHAAGRLVVGPVGADHGIAPAGQARGTTRSSARRSSAATGADMQAGRCRRTIRSRSSSWSRRWTTGATTRARNSPASCRSGKSDSTNYMTLACHIELAGTLQTLSRYLYELEKGPLALRVDTVELNTHDNTGQQLTLWPGCGRPGPHATG